MNATGLAADVRSAPVPVMQWFTRLYNYVFDDSNENGFREEGEAGIPEQAINLRLRDGSMYQSTPTDRTGFVPFEEVFPFFAWLVAEVDFTRIKATGVTVVVDSGRPAPRDTSAGLRPPGRRRAGSAASSRRSRSRRERRRAVTAPRPARCSSRASRASSARATCCSGARAPYAPAGQHRRPDVNVAPFDDFPAAPAIPALRPDATATAPSTETSSTAASPASSTTRRPRGERPALGRAPRCGSRAFPGVTRAALGRHPHAALNEVTTDSWDDGQPDRLPWARCSRPTGGTPRDCFDGLRNCNQVRPAVFDGGYAFLSQIEPVTVTADHQLAHAGGGRGAGFRKVPLPAGKYVVKVIVPDGYKIVKEEDKNVDFGERVHPAGVPTCRLPARRSATPPAPPRARVEERRWRRRSASAACTRCRPSSRCSPACRGRMPARRGPRATPSW